MSRDWKPGDVAAWDIDGQVELIFFRVGGQDFDQPGWQTARDGEGYPTDDQLRPVVVIDPEDREQVVRLSQRVAAAECGDGMAPVDALQAALRSLIAPPRPDEPLGLGAVVEDDEGHKWLRVAWPLNPWCKANPVVRGQDFALHGTHTQWDRINAVRVLSAGWSE